MWSNAEVKGGKEEWRNHRTTQSHMQLNQHCISAVSRYHQNIYNAARVAQRFYEDSTSRTQEYNRFWDDKWHT